MEGLAEIVVGPGLEPVDTFVPGVARGQHQHRQVAPVCAPVTQHLESGAARQSEVEHHHVIGLGVAELLAADAVGGMIDGEPGGLERRQQRRDLGRVILYQ